MLSCYYENVWVNAFPVCLEEEGTQSASRRLAESYGSRTGFIRTYWHRIQYLLGRYRNYSNIDWASVDRLVFVCKGNICRSAFAEAVAKSLGMDAVSCGLQTVISAPANEDAVKTAREMGYALDEHRTTPIMYIVIQKRIWRLPWNHGKPNILADNSFAPILTPC